MIKDKRIIVAISLKESTVKKLKEEAEKKDVSLSALIQSKVERKD